MATNNAINTPVITLGGPFTISGAFTTAFTVTNNTSLTLPISGTLATTSQVLTWNHVTTNNVNASAGNGYIADFTSVFVNFFLPTSNCPMGSIIRVEGIATGLFGLRQNSGQQIFFGNLATTVGPGGHIDSTQQYDGIEILCIVDNTTFKVSGSHGNFGVT